MCGRVKMEGDFSQLKVAFGIPDDRQAINYAPSWNVAPTDSLPIVRYNAKEGHRTLDLMRWGLVPYWAKDLRRPASVALTADGSLSDDLAGAAAVACSAATIGGVVGSLRFRHSRMSLMFGETFTMLKPSNCVALPIPIRNVPALWISQANHLQTAVIQGWPAR
jgi:hypothetical protein